MSAAEAGALLDVEHLRTYIGTPAGTVHAVDDVSLRLRKGEAYGLVGESGSGKSMFARSILGLLPRTAARSGTAMFDGQDLLRLDGSALREIWGKRVGVVFQDPSRSLNPVVKVERQLTEGMRRHLGIGRTEATQRAVRLLGEVGVPDPERRLDNYPGQLSGGMRQRVMIAIALSCEPDLLIADEPTTALDVTIQRQILDLLGRIRRDRDMAMILISHDLGVIAGRTDRVGVMYAGRLVESGTTAEVFARPRHRYTEALLAATPSVTLPRHSRLKVIAGGLPDAHHPPAGCRFEARCPHRRDACADPGPELVTVPGVDHSHRCLFPVGTGDGRSDTDLVLEEVSDGR
ncbi:ABC transporter ATP-binding protein [Actinomadura sp. SCN-SB]|uniref:ABC transporter ATP-binding protein n=1 Tax=Actinomadura sp. SCN-SB TaxID=3373092 RepID=UPI003751C46E